MALEFFFSKPVATPLPPWSSKKQTRETLPLKRKTGDHLPVSALSLAKTQTRPKATPTSNTPAHRPPRSPSLGSQNQRPAVAPLPSVKNRDRPLPPCPLVSSSFSSDDPSPCSSAVFPQQTQLLHPTAPQRLLYSSGRTQRQPPLSSSQSSLSPTATKATTTRQRPQTGSPLVLRRPPEVKETKT